MVNNFPRRRVLAAALHQADAAGQISTVNPSGRTPANGTGTRGICSVNSTSGLCHSHVKVSPSAATRPSRHCRAAALHASRCAGKASRNSLEKTIPLTRWSPHDSMLGAHLTAGRHERNVSSCQARRAGDASKRQYSKRANRSGRWRLIQASISAASIPL